MFFLCARIRKFKTVSTTTTKPRWGMRKVEEEEEEAMSPCSCCFSDRLTDGSSAIAVDFGLVERIKRKSIGKKKEPETASCPQHQFSTVMASQSRRRRRRRRRRDAYQRPVTEESLKGSVCACVCVYTHTEFIQLYTSAAATYASSFYRFIYVYIRGGYTVPYVRCLPMGCRREEKRGALLLQ